MKQLIGKRIRKIRESKDYSQENVAGELGITTSAYSKIERGVTDAATSKLIKIAEILEVDVSVFFADINPVVNQTKEPKLLYGFATKSDIEEVLKLVQSMNEDLTSLRIELQDLKKKKTNNI